jgi:hypothetical protein
MASCDGFPSRGPWCQVGADSTTTDAMLVMPWRSNLQPVARTVWWAFRAAPRPKLPGTGPTPPQISEKTASIGSGGSWVVPGRQGTGVKLNSIEGHTSQLGGGGSPCQPCEGPWSRPTHQTPFARAGLMPRFSAQDPNRTYTTRHTSLDPSQGCCQGCQLPMDHRAMPALSKTVSIVTLTYRTVWVIGHRARQSVPIHRAVNNDRLSAMLRW